MESNPPSIAPEHSHSAVSATLTEPSWAVITCPYEHIGKGFMVANLEPYMQEGQTTKSHAPRKVRGSKSQDEARAELIGKVHKILACVIENVASNYHGSCPCVM